MTSHSPSTTLPPNQARHPASSGPQARGFPDQPRKASLSPSAFRSNMDLSVPQARLYAGGIEGCTWLIEGHGVALAAVGHYGI